MGDLKYEMDEYGNVKAVGGGASGGSVEDNIAALKRQINKPELSVTSKSTRKRSFGEDLGDVFLGLLYICLGVPLIPLGIEIGKDSGIDRIGGPLYVVLGLFLIWRGTKKFITIAKG